MLVFKPSSCILPFNLSGAIIKVMSQTKIKQKQWTIFGNSALRLFAGLLLLGITMSLCSQHVSALSSREVPVSHIKQLAVEPLEVPVVNTYKQEDVDKGTNDTCGDGDNAVKMSIDIGCKGLGNPIMDAVFAVIRFLTIGVGIVVIGSTIFAGIQFTTSRGDPNATGQAMKRISSNIGALVLFILTYAILNWLVPGTILK